jgi:N-acetylneuraminic acid mutarotase
MPNPTVWGSIVTYNGLIYYLGGISYRTTAFQNVERYDPLHDKWDKLSLMTSPRIHHGTIVYNDNIYVFGGVDGLPNTSTEVIRISSLK